MSWTSWVKNFLKTGKVNGYEQAKNLLLGEGKEEEIASFLDFLPREEQEKLFTECWTQLSEPKKRILVNSIYRNDWQALTKDYDELTELDQIKRLELLGYISVPDVIDFLLEKMKSKKEAIRLSACGALKKQEPELILEPILKALTQPDEWLPSRVFEILQGLGPGMHQHLLEILQETEEKVQEVIIQILGEIGCQSCIPHFERLYPKAGPRLRQKLAEALEKLKVPDSRYLLAKLLDDERWQTRMLAAKALGQLGLPEMIPLLENKLREEQDPLVKECISDAVQNLEESSQTVGSWVRIG